jgi:hypothetical protein
MGVSSAQVTADANIISVKDAVAGVIFATSGGVMKCTDGTTEATVTVSGGWVRTDELLIAHQTNAAKTTHRIGYSKNGAATITWGTAVAYDGSQNPSTHLRFGYSLTVPIGFLQTQVWNKSCTDTEILSLMRYAS